MKWQLSCQIYHFKGYSEGTQWLETLHCIVRNNPTIRKITTKFHTFWWLLHCGYSLSRLSSNKKEQGFPEVVPAILNRQTRGEPFSNKKTHGEGRSGSLRAIVVVHGSQRFCTLAFFIWAGTEVTDFFTLITLVVAHMLGSLWSSGESAASPSCPSILYKPRDLAFQSTNPIMSFPTFMFALEVKPRLVSAACRHGTCWPFTFLMWLPASCHPTSSNAVAEFLNMLSHTLPLCTSDIASNGFSLGKIQPTSWDTLGRPFLRHLWIYPSISHHLLHKYLSTTSTLVMYCTLAMQLSYPGEKTHLSILGFIYPSGLPSALKSKQNKAKQNKASISGTGERRGGSFPLTLKFENFGALASSWDWSPLYS